MQSPITPLKPGTARLTLMGSRRWYHQEASRMRPKNLRNRVVDVSPRLIGKSQGAIGGLIGDPGKPPIAALGYTRWPPMSRRRIAFKHDQVKNALDRKLATVVIGVVCGKGTSHFLPHRPQV